ncbi:hypothetical protein [Sinomonas flava]|uniref:hypothetical protein n=1 Tax=Sinomonas flava TaxID=496857 RepID=UPI0039A72647
MKYLRDTGLPRRHVLRAMAGTAAAVVLLPGTGRPASAAAGEEVRVSGVLRAGTPGQVVYEAIKPSAWNGTLVLDLDFNRWAAPQRQWFLDNGYAIGGNQRTQNETAYDITGYVDNLVETRRILAERVAATTGADSLPTRTIAFGASRGGFVARMAPQHRPDVFDGAVAFAGGGAGVLASWLPKADAVWTLKQLVDPNSPLAVSGLPDLPAGATYGADYQQDRALADLVTTARMSDAGMARLVLAAAFEQATDWPSGETPPARDDFRDQGDRIAASFAFANPQFVHKEIEVMAGGPVTWNHGVDYAQLLQRSGALKRVKWWYAQAGLDLDADLAALAAAPRFAADPAAVAAVERIGTFTGNTGGAPVLSVKTIGDSADPVALETAYTRTFREAGTLPLLRTAYIARSGHSTQSMLERIAAFLAVVERLDKGSWGNTSAQGLTRLASAVAAGATTALGDARFVEYQPDTALRTWDATDWGTYLPA